MEHVDRFGSWGELYVMLGSASAALIGLLFVAASLHLHQLVSDTVYRLRAQYTALLLVGTLVQAAIVLAPQPRNFLGAELLLANLWGIAVPIYLLFKAVSIKKADRRGGFSHYRALFFIIGYLFGIVGSVTPIQGATWGMYLVTVSYVHIVIATIWNAWMIMLGIGLSEKKSPH